MKGERACGKCEFFADESQITNSALLEAGWGECRRRAPRGMNVIAHVPDATRLATVIMQFPPVPPTDWCGEFSPRPSPMEDGDG